MASRPEENLTCSVCSGIFQEPVLLICSHSFCRACIQRWWTQKTTLECPLCKTISSQMDPPLNLALKNLCEAFLLQKTERPSTDPTDLCSLHSENLTLFCLDDHQPLCVICRHDNHTIRPIDEAAREYKDILREILRPSRESLELFGDIRRNFDQTVQDIEVQARDTERQIKDAVLLLQKLLKDEERERVGAVREEKEQKSQLMKRRSEALSRHIAALSDAIGVSEEVLRADDLSFLQNYKTAAEIAQHCLPDVPQLIPGGLIDMNKQLNNLSSNILDSMRKVASTWNPKPADGEPTVVCLRDSLSRLRVRERWSRYDTGACGGSQSGAVPKRPLSQYAMIHYGILNTKL